MAVEAEASPIAPADAGAAALDEPGSRRGPGVVVLFGAPGSGKGTQAAVLAEHLGVPAISTGEMLRRAVASGSELGQRVKVVLDRGDLVDDALMAELVRDRLAQGDAARGSLLDGYPRTRRQAEVLDEILATSGRRVERVVMIEVPEAELTRRAVERRRGADDRPEVVRDRLRVYEEKTAPVAEFYRERGQLVTVDGFRAIDEVTEAIVSTLRRQDES